MSPITASRCEVPPSTVRHSQARAAVAPCGAAVLQQRARYFSITAGSLVRAAALPAGAIPALPALPAAPGRAAAEPRAGGAAHARPGPEGAAGLEPVRAPRWGCGSAGAAAGWALRSERSPACRPAPRSAPPPRPPPLWLRAPSLCAAAGGGGGRRSPWRGTGTRPRSASGSRGRRWRPGTATAPSASWARRRSSTRPRRPEVKPGPLPAPAARLYRDEPGPAAGPAGGRALGALPPRGAVPGEASGTRPQSRPGAVAGPSVCPGAALRAAAFPRQCVALASGAAQEWVRLPRCQRGSPRADPAPLLHSPSSLEPSVKAQPYRRGLAPINIRTFQAPGRDRLSWLLFCHCESLLSQLAMRATAPEWTMSSFSNILVVWVFLGLVPSWSYSSHIGIAWGFTSPRENGICGAHQDLISSSDCSILKSGKICSNLLVKSV